MQKENDVLKQNAQELWEKLQKYEERNVLGDKTNIKSSTPNKNEVIKVLEEKENKIKLKIYFKSFYEKKDKQTR